MCLGIPGRIVEIFTEHGIRMGKIDFGGVFRRACLEHVPEAKVGDYAVIHVGFAISTVDEAEAHRVFEFLDSMNDLAELKAGDREIP